MTSRLGRSRLLTITWKQLLLILSLRFSPADQYQDPLLRDCCLDGIRRTPWSYGCERREEYIDGGEACLEAFLRCCEETIGGGGSLRTTLSKTGPSPPDVPGQIQTLL